jgi:hypothetical protein
VSHSAVFVTTFLAAAVEVIVMVIIVVASAPFAGGGRPSLAPQPRAARLPPLQDGELVAQDQDLCGLPRFLTLGQPQPRG